MPEKIYADPLAVELMNTMSTDSSGALVDAIQDTHLAAAWLRQHARQLHSQAGQPVSIDSPNTAGALRDLRDALRALAADLTNDPRQPSSPMARAAALTVLNRHAQTWPELHWSDGPRGLVYRTAGGSGPDAVALIGHQGVLLFGTSGAERLRACLAPNCHHFFLREGGRREWCSPACGNRARVARHYQRHHADRAPHLAAQEG